MAEKAAPYAEAYAGFRLGNEEAKLIGSLEGGINACVECCDRWPADRQGRDGVGGQQGHAATVTFARPQGALRALRQCPKSAGRGPGDVVACMLPRIPDLLTVALGTWRAGAVYQPLFTAFGPKAIEHRLKTSQARLVVTDPANRPKLDEILDAPQSRGDDADFRRGADCARRSGFRARDGRRLGKHSSR